MKLPPNDMINDKKIQGEIKQNDCKFTNFK